MMNYHHPDDPPTVPTLEVVGDNHAAVAVLRVPAHFLDAGPQGSAVFEFTASAKRHPKDPPNIGVGRALAIARVLEAAAHYFADLADNRVDVNCGRRP